MGELEYLAAELRALDEVVDLNENHISINFDADRPGALSSELVSILGRYDCDLYHQDALLYDFKVVVP
jgi:hypothetical protein